MKSPHEGQMVFKMSFRRPRGPFRFIVASLMIDILSQGRNSLPVVGKLQPYALGLPNMTSSVVVRQRCLPAGGAHWPEGPTGFRGRGALAPVPPGYATTSKSSSCQHACRLGLPDRVDQLAPCGYGHMTGTRLRIFDRGAETLRWDQRIAKVA